MRQFVAFIVFIIIILTSGCTAHLEKRIDNLEAEVLDLSSDVSTIYVKTRQMDRFIIGVLKDTGTLEAWDQQQRMTPQDECFGE